MLTYDTDFEEYAYHKDADALFKSAHARVHKERIQKFEDCFVNLSVYWIVWHGDDETALLFNGARSEVSRLLKSLDDRDENDMGL